MLSSRDKVIVLFITLFSILATAIVLYFNYFETSDIHYEDESQDKSTEVKTDNTHELNNQETLVSASVGVLTLDNNTPGIADLKIVLNQETTLVGAELYFYIDGTLDVTNVTCSANFTCLEIADPENTVSVVALRPIEKGNELLIGTHSIAQISYDPSTSGSLVINSEHTRSSIVSPVGSTDNLISIQEQTFQIGR